MPRFYFHLFNNLETRDDEGIHLDDLDAARTHAVREARQVMSADVKDRGEINLSHRIDVDDEFGATLAVVMFDDAISIIGKPATL